MQRQLPNAIVRSAGTARTGAALDPHTLSAARDVGVELDDHVSRAVDRATLHEDGADLVLVMTRQHLREVVGIDPSVWPRPFTLKELARRAEQFDPAAPGERVGSWLRRVGAGRQARDLMTPSTADDVADPYGAPRRDHVAMLEEVSAAVDVIARRGPWHSDPDEP